MPKTAEQMREMRRKYGLGEFSKKRRVKTATPRKKMRPRANVSVSKTRFVPRGTFSTGRRMAEEVAFLGTGPASDVAAPPNLDDEQP